MHGFFDKALGLRAVVATALALALCFLYACGNSSESKVVATVGKSEISQANLSHWMATTVGGDYREQSAEVSPEGLVSDPPDYARCVAAIRTIKTSTGGSTKLGDGQLRLKCRQLYAAVKEQALSLLISVLWQIEQGAEEGLHVGDAELSDVLDRIRHEEYSSPAAFRRYLSEQHRSLSDERYLLRRNILNQKLLAKLKARAGSGPAGEKAFTKLVLRSNAKWSAKTDCRPGYRAPQCRQGKNSSQAASPSAATLVEDLRAGR